MEDARKEIRATITGDVSGQVAVGDQNVQRQTVVEARLSPEEAEELRGLFAALREVVVAEAPPEEQDAALEHVEELEEALTAETPDLSALERAKRWLGEKLPAAGKAVGNLLRHPVVAKLVGAAGEALTVEFRRRLGLP